VENPSFFRILLGGIYQFSRIGGGSDSLTDNALFPSIGVNYYSDAAVSFSKVSASSYVGASYMFRDSRDQIPQNAPYTYQKGLGPYLNNTERLGDYSRTTVDPDDDFTLWTSVEFAGSLQSSNPIKYSWQAEDAFIGPHTTPYFIGATDLVPGSSDPGESECPNGAGNPCTLTLKAPSNVQSGDVLIVALDEGGAETNLPTVPRGWSIQPIANQGKVKALQDADGCGFVTTEWIITHQYQSGESNTYNFTLPSIQILSTCQGDYLPELDGSLFAYRAAGANFGNYIVNGFPVNADVSSSTISAFTSTASSVGKTLLNLFNGFNSENLESNGEDVITFTSPAGAPTLVNETPLSGSGQFLAGDVPVLSSGTKFGKYSTSWTTSVTGPAYAWQILVSPN